MRESHSSSAVEGCPPQDQVFINFRGAELRSGFVSHLVEALKKDDINVFIDENEGRGKKIDELLERIENSRIALPIFSARYTDSEWCLRELAKIKECEEKHKLVAIPIFYKLEPATVRGMRGPFGDAFRDLARGDGRREEWKEALQVIPQRMGFTLEEKSKESELLKDIVKAVKNVLFSNPSEESEYTSVDNSKKSSAGAAESYSRGQTDKTFGNEQRMKELKEKMDLKDKGTRFIGVVGMPGIGKTTLLKELYKELRPKFNRKVFIDRIREKLKGSDLEDFPTLLLDELELEYPETDDSEEKYKALKRGLGNQKVLLVLDDVSTAKQINAVLGEFSLPHKPEWINEGSRVVIATNDMSLTEGLVHDTYVVPQLNHRDGLRLFCCHAFEANCPKGEFTKLSDEFVHYARGHPLAIQILGTELRRKNMKHWVEKLDILARNPSTYIGEVLQVSYGELSPQQKDAFLDIACFRSENMDYVESLLASTDPKAADTTSAVQVLRNKFLINTCDSRLEMHDLLYTFSRELDPKASTGSRQRRLWLPQDIIKGGVINIPSKTMKAANIRGIFLDLYELKNETCLESDHFSKMHNLRYLKFYNSHCPQECNTDNKINIPDGLTLPLKEVRCLHWLKFPLEELPDDFNPIKLVDLKLSYSEIERLWEGVKDTPALKWVDLSHSSKLSTLSGLSKAQNLQRLNLEGCTSLVSLGDVNFISLKALILSNCLNFEEFPLVSENLEFLYLDGTAIRQLPDEIVTLQRFVLLNMKNCKELNNISTPVGELKALQKLILSGCFRLKEFPEINKISLNTLLLDGTSIKTIPQLPSSLEFLCLSRNDQISCLPAGFNQLFKLTWLDLKYCKSITSIPELPPNLHYLDAHGCSSLKTVAQPLVRIVPAMQNHCTFSFTNCTNLERAAKEEMTSYAQRKCHLLSDARKHYNGVSSYIYFLYMWSMYSSLKFLILQGDYNFLK
ncbi:Disease resistance protein RPS4B [Hirschfeldia incana]|nr:Disease resistance protein RPS4B [Hirschfeldia incana]